MQDRIVQHPNRYKLVPVAGTSDTYDFVPITGTVTAAGTPINKASLLSDETAATLGLSSNPTVDDAIYKLSPKWVEDMEYTVAGAYSYIVPPGVHRVGAYMCGGGGGGGICGSMSGNSGSGGGGGGGGYQRSIVLHVTPGQTIPLVVGAGGAAGYWSGGASTSPTSGGTTSFAGETIEGGAYGIPGNGSGGTGGNGYSKGGNGAKTNGTVATKGGEPLGAYGNVNAFSRNKFYLCSGGGGGGAKWDANTWAGAVGGYGAGAGGENNSRTGKDATAPGCGGGGTFGTGTDERTDANSRSGSGAAGAITIYRFVE